MGTIKSDWIPNCFLISFKLETDLEILEKKALQAIETYGVDMVIANELKTRRNKVTVYEKIKQVGT